MTTRRHRPGSLRPQAEAVHFGAIGDQHLVYKDSSWAKKLADLAEEDRWREIWAAVLKAGVQQPTIHHSTYAERPLADGTVVHRQPFIVRTGEDPTWFFGTEAKIATALGAKPFVAITGWPVTSGRAGERHPQAFSVFWSDQVPPASPDRLPPAPAAQWVLAGQLNRAFAAAKLERPEIVSARALSEADEERHLWEVRLRLYGGVTLATVRQQAERLRQALGVPYLRVGDASDGVVLYVGTTPDKLRLAQPKADRLRMVGLDWEQAWADAKVISPAGLIPELVRTGTLPHNPAVEVLDFTLPSGLDRAQVRAALAKLRASTGNEFIELRDSPDGAGAVRLLVCPSNPLPEVVSLDFDEMDRHLSQGIPFATGIEGERVMFSPLESAHLLMAGVTGSGKSSMAQVLLYGFAVLGARVVVVDPQKSGADFRFIKPYADAFASTPHEAATALKAIYAEVVRRKELNARHGVGFYLDLPDEVRPEPVCVLVDEFTSLMGQSPVPKPTDDPDFESQREELIADNQARAQVGILVGKLAREARSSGLTLLLGTQKLSVKMLDAIPGGAGDVKTNLARILLGKASSGDRLSALRAVDDAPVLVGDIPKGRGLWEPLTSSAVAIQCWYAPQADLAAELAKRRHPLNDSETHQLAAGRRRAGPGAITTDPMDLDRDSDHGAPSGELDDKVKNATERAGPPVLANDWGVRLDWGSPRPAAAVPDTASPSDNEWPVFDGDSDSAVSVKPADHSRQEAEW